MEIDWVAAEKAILAGIKKRVRQFAKKHPDECFYGFCLAGNPGYFEVMAYLNTNTLLRQRAKEYKAKHTELPPYDVLSVDQIMSELRWSPGDWAYMFFDAVDHTNAFYEALITRLNQDRYVAATPSCDYRAEEDRFLEMLNRVTTRLKESNAFEPLNCTSRFQVRFHEYG